MCIRDRNFVLDELGKLFDDGVIRHGKGPNVFRAMTNDTLGLKDGRDVDGVVRLDWGRENDWDSPDGSSLNGHRTAAEHTSQCIRELSLIHISEPTRLLS